MNTYRSFSSGATKKFAKGLARKILKKKPAGRAIVVALAGELGSGKTTFAQGFAAGLGVRKKVLSPTFILMRNTKLPQLGNSELRNFIHVDAYRADAADFLKLGFKKLAADPENLILIEWADKMKKILPKSALRIKFEHGEKENERVVYADQKL